jgi:hypothetical protein
VKPALKAIGSMAMKNVIAVGSVVQLLLALLPAANPAFADVDEAGVQFCRDFFEFQTPSPERMTTIDQASRTSGVGLGETNMVCV